VPVNVAQVGGAEGPWVGITDAPILLEFDLEDLSTKKLLKYRNAITSTGGVELFSTAHPCYDRKGVTAVCIRDMFVRIHTYIPTYLHAYTYIHMYTSISLFFLHYYEDNTHIHIHKHALLGGNLYNYFLECRPLGDSSNKAHIVKTNKNLERTIVGTVELGI
jgi:hypothetical protein